MKTLANAGNGKKAGVTPRQIALAAALAATLAATLWLAQQDDEDAQTVVPLARASRATRAAPAPAVPASAPPLSAQALQRPPWPEAPAAQLAAWSAPPPPPPPPAPPPAAAQAPVAPPFPYQLIGRLEQGGVSQALLAGASRSLSAKPGDVIDGQWRVERVEATGLVLTWLPGKQSQTINFRPS